MDFDFHYYGTYSAARFAGYDEEQASKIAKSAQFVDEYTYENFKSKDAKNYTAFDFKAKGCAGQLFASDRSLAKIWIPFHFPPRLSAQQGVQVGFNAFTAKTNVTDADLQYITAPTGKLFGKLIALESVKENDLMAVGLKMHVLADSYAHQGFVGYRRKSINCISGDVEQMTEDEVTKSKTMPFTVLYAVGHADANHRPDCGYVKYSYTPYWSEDGKSVTRDNPEIFADAYVAMVMAMDEHKNGKTQTKKTQAQIDARRAEILNLLRKIPKDESGKPCDFQEENWIEFMTAKEEMAMTKPSIETQIASDKKSVLEHFKSQAGSEDLQAFDEASKSHYNMVNDLLNPKLEDFPLWK